MKYVPIDETNIFVVVFLLFIWDCVGCVLGLCRMRFRIDVIMYSK